MFALFVGLMVIGVGLLLLQSFGGHAADGGLDADGSGDFSADASSIAHPSEHDAPWLLLANVRFWAFACAATGTIGTLGLWLTDTSRMIVALVAAGSGLAFGLLVTYALHRLQRDSSSSLASVGTSRGRVGRVVLAIGEGGRGKVRIEIKGALVDLVARADAPLEAGAEVVVIEVDGTEAHVVRVPKELNS